MAFSRRDTWNEEDQAMESIFFYMWAELLWYVSLSSIYETTEFQNVYFLKEIPHTKRCKQIFKRIQSQFT